jgi:Prohead core protein serine protease
MKLFCDINEEVQVLTEEVAPGQKNYFIEGIFLMCDQKNRNGRVYTFEMMDKKVKDYNNGFVKQKRAFGELGHPEGPTINLERVSHMITDLYSDKKNFIGRAKIMDTPYGKIVKNLIDEGAKLGVSSRGVGSLEEKNGINYVKDDFQIATAADIVADPSAPEAFVRGIMEGKEWIFESGRLIQQDMEQIKKDITKASSRKLEEAKIKAFEKFLRNL